MRPHMLFFALTALLVSGTLGCTEPIEPGSDLEDPAPAAELGDLQDYDIVNATFEIDSTVETGSDVPEEMAFSVPLGFLYSLTLNKDGDLVTSTATLSGELNDKLMPDNPPIQAGEDTPVNVDGSFIMTFQNVVLPPDPSNPMSMPQEATLTLDAQIRSQDCVTGTATLTIVFDTFPIDLTGDFIATREGSDASCQAMEDAQ